MRLTREILIKIARETANQKASVSRRILCIYLTGSVLSDSPLLGGTTDIDLVVVEDSEPLQPREIIRVSDEVHLDIAHYAQDVFRQPRHLRTDPWLGPFIYSKPIVFHDTQHWFEFTQASTGAQFYQPEYTYQRVNKLAQAARKAWMDLELNPDDRHLKNLNNYFGAVENAGNALASLYGEPLAERRFMLQLPQRLQALQMSEMTSGLTHLIAPDIEHLEDAWAEWLHAWKTAFHQAGSRPDVPPQLHPARQAYYERAITAMWDENPIAALWLMLKTWVLAGRHLPEDGTEENAINPLQAALNTLQLDEEHFTERLAEMDQYLDRVEEAIERWARSNGVSTMPEL